MFSVGSLVYQGGVTSNKNPALTSFLKLLRERYPLLSSAARCRAFGIEWRAK
jgi:hypothetical protein